jgi:NAD(P)-dependent dehydrogenase (short-subunit alcohol dehydrogenase family)
MAEALAEAGADVAITSRTVDGAERAAAEIARATGRRALGVAAEVQRGESVAAMAAEVEATLGPVDILVNNAGFGQRATIE